MKEVEREVPEGARDAAINVIWLSRVLTSLMKEEFMLAMGRFLYDEDWYGWIASHIDFPAHGHTLTIDDVDKERLRLERRSGEVDYTVPAHRLVAAEAEERLPEVFLDILHRIYLTSAERDGVAEPPAHPPTRESWLPPQFEPSVRGA